MQVVSVDELVSIKILPFDLYNENGKRIFGAGEVITPGKLLQLRYISVIYKDLDLETESFETNEDDNLNISSSKVVVPEKIVSRPEKTSELPKKLTFQDDNKINKVSKITKNAQITIKTVYTKALNNFYSNNSKENLKCFIDAKDKMIEEILPVVDKITHRSELKIIGEYDQYHGLNVAILSTVLSKKLQLKDEHINNIALSAMLHDIGKTRIPAKILAKVNPTPKEFKLITLHPQIGYKILKREMELPENICKVALEHHEKSDGSGYPYGISGELISIPAQIVSICSIYDNLIAGKGHVPVKNVKEALRAMTEIGTKWFSPEIFYTFLHMSTYNDLTLIEELQG